jgi:hypothetical protein
MARIRTIKPEFPHSESMGRVSRDARLLFMLSWTIVDDFGRARGASRLLASLLYPYDDDAPALMDGWLTELEDEGCVRRYEVDGTQYLEICNWLKHQKIDHPSRSKFPGPDDISSETLAKPREDVADPRASRARAGPRTKDLGPRTKDLDQEEEGSGRARSREGTEENPGECRNPAAWPADYREQFEAAYPHKVGMAVALKALDAARSSGRVSWRVVIEALEAYAAKTDDRAWCNPKTWIEQERWNDRPAKPPSNGAKPSPGDRARRLARQMEARERAGPDQRPADAVGGADIGGDDARLVSGAQRK